MYFLKKILLIILIGLGAFVCVWKDIDMRQVHRVGANSPQTFRSSIQEIDRRLSTDEKVVFAKGLRN